MPAVNGDEPCRRRMASLPVVESGPKNTTAGGQVSSQSRRVMTVRSFNVNDKAHARRLGRFRQPEMLHTVHPKTPVFCANNTTQ